MIQILFTIWATGALVFFAILGVDDDDFDFRTTDDVATAFILSLVWPISLSLKIADKLWGHP